VDHEANLSETSDEGNLESLGDGLCDVRIMQTFIFDDHHNRKLRTRPLARTKRLLFTVFGVSGPLRCEDMSPNSLNQSDALTRSKTGFPANPHDSPLAQEPHLSKATDHLQKRKFSW